MNKPLLALLIISISANVLYLYTQDEPIPQHTDSTQVLLSEGKNVYLTVKDLTKNEDRKLNVQSQPGEVVELLVRPATDFEKENMVTLDQMLEGIIGHKNSAVTNNSQAKLSTSDTQQQSWLRYSWQNPLHPELVKLRKREKLDSVIASGKSEIEKFFLLLTWTRAQWETGSPNPYPAWNANTILSMIRSGKTSGFCGQYSHVLTQSLQSLGYYARYVGLKNHFALEVYWNEGRKWISLDPLYSCVLMRKDTYLNTHEAYELIHQGRQSEISLFNTKTKTGISGEERDKILKHYSDYNIILKADHLSSRKSGLYFVENAWQHSVVFIDKQLPKKEFLGKTPILTNHLNDLYFPTNNVSVDLIAQNQEQITLELSSHYQLKEIQLSINGSPFQKVPAQVTLKNPNAIKKIRTRGITYQSILGPVSTYRFNH